MACSCQGSRRQDSRLRLPRCRAQQARSQAALWLLSPPFGLDGRSALVMGPRRAAQRQAHRGARPPLALLLPAAATVPEALRLRSVGRWLRILAALRTHRTACRGGRSVPWVPAPAQSQAEGLRQTKDRSVLANGRSLTGRCRAEWRRQQTSTLPCRPPSPPFRRGMQRRRRCHRARREKTAAQLSIR